MLVRLAKCYSYHFPRRAQNLHFMSKDCGKNYESSFRVLKLVSFSRNFGFYRIFASDMKKTIF